MSCQKQAGGPMNYRLWNPKFNATVAEIQSTCDGEQAKLKARLEAIAKVGASARFQDGCLELERALTALSQNLSPLIFLKYVSDKSEIREVAGKCETAIEQMRVDVFAREDLFAVLKAAKQRGEKLAAADSKLLEEFLLSFKRNGLELPADKRKEFIEKRKRIVQLETDFSKELIEWKDGVEFTLAQLEGMPESFVHRLEKTPKGLYKVTVKYPDYYPFMENAKNAEARRLLEEKFYLRGGSKNQARLEETLKLRHETATMLGYPSHAAYVLDDRMARKTSTVDAFLQRVGKRIAAKAEEDLSELVAAKNIELGAKSDRTIHSHDWRYYDNQIKKNKHNIDMQKIKEYFPLDVVNKGMFEIYETLLGVKFVEDKTIAVWHPSVTAYRVNRGEKTVAIFFMDLFPREGKYGHAAAFTLVQGCANADGTYETPLSSIVANFNPPADGKPSLLEHGEVETLFHEFGHIMHQVLTTASHASLSGTSVKRDFVEAPSQMLENWVWEAPTLTKLSGHYQDHSKPLPQDQLQRLIDAKLLNVGIRYSRQLLFATLDQQYHSQAKPDTTGIYTKLSKELMHIPIPEKTLPQAGFGHLMGGYDAGYYGYLWSEVYAQDMFTRFENEGLLNPSTGADYLKWILQPGGEQEPMELISHFLARDPSEDAFFKSLGL
jgi:thimet oligopeptidase